MQKFGRVDSKTSRRETEKIHIKLATTSNNNEQQQNAKNNSELWTECTEVTWKIF